MEALLLLPQLRLGWKVRCLPGCSRPMTLMPPPMVNLFLVTLKWRNVWMYSETWKRKYVWIVSLTTFVTFSMLELARCQLELTELAQLIQRLHWLEGGMPITNTDLEMRISMHVSIEYVDFKSNLCSVCPQLQQSYNCLVQNLTLTKPKKKTGKMFGHSRTLSRVEDLGVMVVNLSHCLNFHHSSLRISIPSLKQVCLYNHSSLLPVIWEQAIQHLWNPSPTMFTLSCPALMWLHLRPRSFTRRSTVFLREVQTSCSLKWTSVSNSVNWLYNGWI